MDIRRGIIRAFDSGTYLADVQIVGSMATVLTGVPVAKQIAADLLTSGTKCGVLFFDETNPSDACVVFIYDGAPVPWITSALIKDGEVAVADLALATIQGVGSIFIPSQAFDVVGHGSPALGFLGPEDQKRMATWRLDANAREGVGTQFVVPLTGDIEIKYYYAMQAATSGVVRLSVQYLAIADGEDCDATGSYGVLSSTVPGTAKYLKAETPVSSMGVTAGDLLRLQAIRAGNHADDTATGDLHFLGLGIRYV